MGRNKMKYLLDLKHPAHFHFWKYFKHDMEEHGNEFIITSRDKDCLLELLDDAEWDHVCLSKQKKGKFQLLKEFYIRIKRLIKIVRNEKPDFIIGNMGPIISIVGWWTKTPTYVAYENESAKITNKIAYLFCTKFITPHNFRGKVPKNKHVTYKGLQQLAFLHPNQFERNSDEKRKKILIRVVSHESSHDPKTGWIDLDRILHIVDGYGEIIFSSEKVKPKWKASEFHDILNECWLVVSESPTICAEAACLGIPSIYISKSKRGFIDELEKKYGLVYQRHQYDISVILDEIKKIDFTKSYERLIVDSDDVTQWLINYFLAIQQTVS